MAGNEVFIHINCDYCFVFFVINMIPVKKPFIWKMLIMFFLCFNKKHLDSLLCSGSMVECLTLDQRAAGSCLTCVTTLCP